MRPEAVGEHDWRGVRIVGLLPHLLLLSAERAPLFRGTPNKTNATILAAQSPRESQRTPEPARRGRRTPLNRRVVGSSPTGPTSETRRVPRACRNRAVHGLPRFCAAFPFLWRPRTLKTHHARRGKTRHQRHVDGPLARDRTGRDSSSRTSAAFGSRSCTRKKWRLRWRTASWTRRSSAPASWARRRRCCAAGVRQAAQRWSRAPCCTHHHQANRASAIRSSVTKVATATAGPASAGFSARRF